jgi:methylmalonyl-CoA mutase N-terminal domain/subunit
LRVSPDVEREQVASLAARRESRPRSEADVALKAMAVSARSGSNVIPAMLDAVRAEATLGEICDALREEWGTYSEPAAF